MKKHLRYLNVCRTCLKAADPTSISRDNNLTGIQLQFSQYGSIV
jgi:hypothetical protein